MAVRQINTNDFRILWCRLRQQVFVAGNNVGETHIFFEGVAAGAQHMSLQVNGVLVVSGHGENMDFVAILNGKLGKLFCYGFRIFARIEFQAEHGALLVSFHALDFNVIQGCGGKNAAGQLHDIGQGLFAFQFVDGRTAHHAVDGNFGSER